MSGYHNFLIRTMLNGKNSREDKINDARHILKLEFKNDPSYNDNMYRWVPGETPHKSDKIDIRMFNRKYSSANGYTVQFEIQINDKPDVGDYYFDEEDNQYWICTEIYNVNDIHFSGKLTLCNWVLKWQDAFGRILEYPCNDINSTQYNSGESSDKTMTLGTAQHMATVQATKDTIAIRSPQRFFISRDYTIPFCVTQNDTIANNYGNGLCKITLTQDTLNENDRPDLGICDYIEQKNITQPSQNKDGISAMITGGDALKVGHQKSWHVKFQNKYGNETEVDDYTWKIVSDFDITNTIDNDTITLLVENEDLVESSFLLQILVGNEVLTEKQISIIEGF